MTKNRTQQPQTLTLDMAAMTAMNTPEFFRVLGGVEASVKTLTETVGNLVKSNGDLMLAVTRTAEKMNGFNEEMASMDKRINAAQEDAQKATKVAEKAHVRIDRMIWISAGFGAGVGATVAIVAPKVAELGLEFLKAIH